MGESNDVEALRALLLERFDHLPRPRVFTVPLTILVGQVDRRRARVVGVAPRGLLVSVLVR